MTGDRAAPPRRGAAAGPARGAGEAGTRPRPRRGHRVTFVPQLRAGATLVAGARRGLQSLLVASPSIDVADRISLNM